MERLFRVLQNPCIGGYDLEEFDDGGEGIRRKPRSPLSSGRRSHTNVLRLSDELSHEGPHRPY